jgi:hypothetical protein
MDNVSMLNNITLHFNKLLVECKDGNTFIPPVFNNTSDLDGLMVLYQILHIMCERRLNPSISNILLYQTLVQIVHIKCKEHIETKWNKNLDGFISTFETYTNSMVDNILACKQ